MRVHISLDDDLVKRVDELVDPLHEVVVQADVDAHGPRLAHTSAHSTGAFTVDAMRSWKPSPTRGSRRGATQTLNRGCAELPPCRAISRRASRRLPWRGT